VFHALGAVAGLCENEPFVDEHGREMIVLRADALKVDLFRLGYLNVGFVEPALPVERDPLTE